MSYIDEINRFHKFLRTSDLSPSARLLWFVLMDVANSTGWKPTFNVALSTLESGTGLTRRTIITVRKELEEAGLIKVQSRGGRKSALYSMVKFEGTFAGNNFSQVVSQNDFEGTFAGNNFSQVVPIPRQDKIKDKDKKRRNDDNQKDPVFSELVKTFSCNIHPITALESQMLESDYKEYGEQWVKDAIKIAVKRGHFNISYIEGILKRAKANGKMDIESSNGKKGLTEEEKRELIEEYGFERGYGGL